MSAPVDVLRRRLNRAFHGKEMSLGSYTEACELMQAIDRREVAVAELIKCSSVTVKAFEALGRTNGIVDQLEAHRQCERALIEQKAALARVTGAQS